MTLIRYTEQVETESELRAEFKRYVTEQGLGHEGSPHELFLRTDLTPAQRRYVLDFVLRWDIMLRRTEKEGVQTPKPTAEADVVHTKLDELLQLCLLTFERANVLRERLASPESERDMPDDIAFRDIIDMYAGLSEAVDPGSSIPIPDGAIPDEERFAAGVLACVEELNTILPQLTSRFETLVIVAALAEHVGGALRVLMGSGSCNEEMARRVLRHIESAAFERESTEQ